MLLSFLRPACRLPASTLGPPGGSRCRRPRPVPVPAAPDDVVYGIGRIDASGRIADRTVISALGWRGGERLTLSADAGVVTARRDPGGMITLPARPHIANPGAGVRPAGAPNFTLTPAPGTKVTCAEAVSRLARDERRWKVRSRRRAALAGGEFRVREGLLRPGPVPGPALHRQPTGQFAQPLMSFPLLPTTA